MIPPRLKLILLASLVAAFVTMPLAPAQQRQRRVFTNDEISRPAPPAAAPAAPATPTTPAEGTSGAEAVPGTPAPSATEAAAGSTAKLPEGLALAEHLQEVLRRFHGEIAVKLDQEVDVVREERWRSMLNLATQLLAQNQLYIAELQAQQPQETEAQAQSAAGSQQPAP
jgi:hypothetical protein